MKRAKLNDRALPDYTKGEEIFNMVSHIVGGAVGICALVLCVVFAALHRNVWGVVSCSIYGAAMVILYTMSSIYHGLSPRLKAKKVFQVIDHCSIFLLIAGTYTPIALCSLRSQKAWIGWTVFGVIWGLAALGITLNSIDLAMFKRFSMICYLGMGWMIVLCAKLTYLAIGVWGCVFLIGGGVFYTVGSVLYLLGKKSRRRYIHSVFHLFVVFGSIMHMFMILFFIV